MASQSHSGLWASDDGSYGNGDIAFVDTESWTKKQWSWFERLENAGEVYAEDLLNIDKNIKPDFE